MPSDPPASNPDEPHLAAAQLGYKPLVSIVMPCFNNEAYVAEAIDSALGQTYDNIEVIVVDDGSTDASLDIIRSYGDRITWRTGPNRGACAARNRGLELTKGEYVKFLDADDRLDLDCVKVQTRQMLAQATPREVVVGDHWLLDPTGTIIRAHRYVHGLHDGAVFGFEQLLRYSPLVSEPLHRKSLLREVGGFRQDVARGQEHELHLRMFLKGICFRYQPAICFYYRQHSSENRISVASRTRHHLARPQALAELLRALEARPGGVPREYRAQLARYCWQHGRTKLQRGDHAAASIMFNLAKSICAQDCLSGSLAYRTLCRISGPNFAEHAGITLAAVLRLWKKRNLHGVSEGSSKSQIKQT